MNKEEFKQEITNRFKKTDSGFGSMTQRELILLHVAGNVYHQQINLNSSNIKKNGCLKCKHNKPEGKAVIWCSNHCVRGNKIESI